MLHNNYHGPSGLHHILFWIAFWIALLVVLRLVGWGIGVACDEALEQFVWSNSFV